MEKSPFIMQKRHMDLSTSAPKNSYNLPLKYVGTKRLDFFLLKWFLFSGTCFFFGGGRWEANHLMTTFRVNSYPPSPSSCQDVDRWPWEEPLAALNGWNGGVLVPPAPCHQRCELSPPYRIRTQKDVHLGVPPIFLG